MYVTSLAISRLLPNYRPWDEKLIDYESQYPFLRSLSLDFQEINYCLNELDLANFAVICDENDINEYQSTLVT